MVRGASRRSGGSFGSGPASSRKSRNEMLRERYSTDRYPTPEDFIRAVEENPDLFDPGLGDNSNFRYDDSGNGRGVSGNNLGGRNKSQWIGDNPVNVDVSTDPGSISVSSEIYSDDSGNAVSLVAGVDLIPMGIDINVNGDVGTIGVDLGMPGDAIGVTVGASFDVNTGEVIGGELGLAGGGLSVSVSQIKKDGEICNTITVTYFGIGTAYQRCRKDDESDEKDPKKEPPPPNDEEYPPIDMPPPPRGDEVGWWCKLITSRSNATGTILQYWGGSGTGTGPTIETFSSSQTEGGMYPVSLWFDWLASNPKISNRKYTLNQVTCWLTHYDYDIMRDGPIVHIPIDFIFIDESLSIVHPTFSECVSPTDWRVPNLDNGNKRDHRIYYHYLFKHFTEKTSSISIGWYFDINKYCEYRDKPSPPPKEPEPPIPPEEPVKCCDLEPVMSMLRKLNQALAVDEIVDKGLELPNEWILPTGKGHSKMNNYLQIAVFLAKMQDHLGVHPMTVQIADLSAGQEGNQEFKKFYPNGTKAIQEILTILHDENSDSADRLNLQMRLAILNTRIFVTVASIARSIRGIFQFLGAPLKERRDFVPLPFDYTYGLRKNKGFSQNAAQDASQLEETMKKLEAELNKNQETATEALLAKFLNDSEQPIIFETFDGSQPDLLALLRVLTTIKGKTNG